MQNNIRVAKSAHQALNSLMTLCAKSEKSSGDARRLMARWGVDPEDQVKVLEALIAQKFIDDSRYAAAFVREKTRLSGWGVYKIRAALMAKGVARSTIDEALSVLDRDSTIQRLEAMLKRKQRVLREVSGYELKGKLMRYGLSLGYDYEGVTGAVDRIVGGIDDDDL